MKSLEIKISLCLVAVYVIKGIVVACVCCNRKKRVEQDNAEQFIVHMKQLLIAFMSLCGQVAMSTSLEEMEKSCDMMMQENVIPVKHMSRLESLFYMIFKKKFFLSNKKYQTSSGNMDGDNTIQVDRTNIADVSLSKVLTQESTIKQYKNSPGNKCICRDLYKFLLRKIDVVYYFLYRSIYFVNERVAS